MEKTREQDKNSANGERKILIVDDNKAIHDDFRKILTRQNKNKSLSALKQAVFGSNQDSSTATADPLQIAYSITSAFQGEEGLALFLKAKKSGDPFSLVFMDVRMPPGWDGIKTIEEIWKVSPHTEIVICSAYQDYSWAEISEKFGPSPNLLILQKPFDVSEVQQITYSLTTRWLNSQNTSQENLEYKANLTEGSETGPNVSQRKTLRTKKADSYHHGDLRSAVVLAGLRILGKKGIDFITLREVAKMLGVSPGAPYRHFKSKDELLVAIAQEGFYKLSQIMRQIPLRLNDPKAQLEHFGLAYLDFSVNNLEHFRLMFEMNILSGTKGYPELDRAVGEVFESLAQIVKNCQNAALIKEGDPFRRTLIVWSAIHGLSSLYANQRLAFLGVEFKQQEITMRELIASFIG